MAVQTAYNTEMAVALEGQIANLEPNTLISRNVEGDPIGFGRVVVQGTADDGVVEASAADQVVRGITVRDQSTAAESVDAFAVGDSALIMTRGVIWVRAGGNVSAGDAVSVAVSGGSAGRFVTGSGLAIPGALFDTSGADGDLVKVRIGGNITGPQGPAGG